MTTKCAGSAQDEGTSPARKRRHIQVKPTEQEKYSFQVIKINVCRTCKSGGKTTTIKETTRKEKNGDKVKRGTATPSPGRRTSRATLSAVPPCATYKISSLPPLQQKQKIQRIPRTTQMRSSTRTSTSKLGTWIWSTKRSKACAPRTRKKE